VSEGPDSFVHEAVSFKAALAGGLRLAAFRPAARATFAPSVRLVIALGLLHIGITVASQIAVVGLPGALSLEALPGAFWMLGLALLCGVACAEATRDASLALRLAVAVLALAVVVSVPIGIAAVVLQRDWFPSLQPFGSHIWHAFLLWWGSAVVIAILRLTRAPHFARMRAVVYGLLLLVAPVHWIPASALWERDWSAEEPGHAPALVSESAFYRQHELLESAIADLAPSRPGVADVYVLTAGLYASEDVFMKEVGVISELLERRFDAGGRVLRLVNNRATLSEAPIATLTSVRRALAAIGEKMDVEEDVLVLYLTSHGSERHRLSVDLWPLALQEIDPAALRRALDDSGVRWRVIVISACYSGGYVEPLENEHTLVITASSAERQSFGCGAESDFTYLAKALFDEELRNTLSFEEAFARAKVSIAQRERAQGFVPSEPQIFVGEAIRAKLTAIERRLAGAAASNEGR
jgi:hypothetical protein